MYAFGIVCVEVFTRSRPFPGITDEFELASKLHNGEGLDVHRLPVEVPPAVRSMIEVWLVIYH